MFNILVCEDEKNIRYLISEYLKRENFNVIECENGNQAIEILDHNHIDLLVTDVMMPGIDGIELVYCLRKFGYEFPILMVTAKETIDDKKEGFNSGADDYMVKPVDMEELVLRVYALLRRSGMTESKQIILGDTILDYESLSVKTPRECTELPKKEFYLLFKLLSYPNRIFTRIQLMDEIWGYEIETDIRTVDVHIKRIREKFADNKDFQICTVRGLGYKAVKNED